MNSCKLLFSVHPGWFCALLVLVSQQAPAAPYQYTTIYGGPEYSSTLETGFIADRLSPLPFSYDLRPMLSVNNNGQAVAHARKVDGGVQRGTRAFRLDGTGGPAVELDHLGTDSTGFTSASAFAINAAGTAVGEADKYAGGQDRGVRAIRWDATGTTAMELGHLGTNTFGSTRATAYAINAAGTAVGLAAKWDGAFSLGLRAVRWDAAGTTATELGHLGTNPATGMTWSEAYAINAAGTAVGFASKIGNPLVSSGTRAVRWDAGGTIATELGHLGIDSSISTNAAALAINDTGTAVGWVEYHEEGDSSVSRHAVRWEAGGTAATELDHLGTDSSGITRSMALAINQAGTAVGYASKYDAGEPLGWRAVRWDAGGTAAIELGHLGAHSSGATRSEAHAINTGGIIVGRAAKYDGDTPLGNRAVYWGLDNVAKDLSDLIHPTSGWSYLEQATAISDTGWITGVGFYDPDGAGGDDPYRRMFLLNIHDITYVPEPTALMLMVAMGVPLLLRRRSIA